MERLFPPIRAEVQPFGVLFRLRVYHGHATRTSWHSTWVTAVRCADLATRGNGPLPLRVVHIREAEGTAVLETR